MMTPKYAAHYECHVEQNLWIKNLIGGIGLDVKTILKCILAKNIVRIINWTELAH
jgi:hypothetical protein